MKIFKGIFVLGLLAAAGCGGGGGDDSSSSGSSETPDVAGTYSLTIKEAPLNCDDNSSTTFPGSTGSTTVIQDGRAIQIGNTSGVTADSGATIITNTGVTGTVDDDGSFTASGTVAERLTTTQEIATLVTDFDGDFTASTVSGTIDINFTLVTADGSSVGTCTGSTTFSGTKTSSTTSADVSPSFAELAIASITAP